MKLPPWYTAEMFTLDAALKGVWWRCPIHGVTTDPVVMSGDTTGDPSSYCAHPDCVERLIVVSRVTQEHDWNRPIHDPRQIRGRATKGAVKDILEAIAASGGAGIHWTQLLRGGRGKSTVQGAIRDLHGYGLVERVSPGVWRVASVPAHLVVVARTMKGSR